jgi:hypothetical protein
MLLNTIIAEYPELEGNSAFPNGTIILQDDSDGVGAYIREWNYSKPIPEGLTLGKPLA